MLGKDKENLTAFEKLAIATTLRPRVASVTRETQAVTGIQLHLWNFMPSITLQPCSMQLRSLSWT